jgi:two-component system, OmpR family, phosphate regulon sensor histidine kinase PhoR
MNWWLRKLLNTCGVVAVGFVLGYCVGVWLHAVVLGAFLGTLFAVGSVGLIDAMRAHRLMVWVGGNHEHSAPRGSGSWGELGYRIERALRIQHHLVAQEQKRLSQFLSAIEAAPNGVLLLDPQDQIVWCNTAGAEHFGLSRQRDHLQPVTNLIRIPEFVAYLQAGQYADPVVVRDRFQNRMTLSILIQTYGDKLKLVLSADITERERAEAMRRDFVANVSHEIRTPLTVVSGFVETLIHLRLDDSERQRVLALTAQQTQRMQTLVADLLTLAQLEGSPRPASDQWVDMRTLLSRAQADAQALSAGRHQFILAEVAKTQLAGSDTELLSAVGNLLSNAVRYTPEGGSITLAWSLRPSGEGELWVQDTGIGVAREHIARLTERFYRVDSSRSRDTGGTGLGLSIVKHIAQRHSGRLDIDSQVQRGSRFAIIFPALRLRVLADG